MEKDDKKDELIALLRREINKGKCIWNDHILGESCEKCKEKDKEFYESLGEKILNLLEK